MIVYHGTSPNNVEAILSQGLVGAHIWLARYEKDAYQFGPVVFQVKMDEEHVWNEDDPACSWQACYHGGHIPPERLTLLAQVRVVAEAQ